MLVKKVSRNIMYGDVAGVFSIMGEGLPTKKEATLFFGSIVDLNIGINKGEARGASERNKLRTRQNMGGE